MGTHIISIGLYLHVISRSTLLKNQKRTDMQQLRLIIFAVLAWTSLTTAENRPLDEDTINGLLTASLETEASSIDTPASAGTQVDAQTQDNENQDQLEEMLNQHSAQDDTAESLEKRRRR